MVLELKDKAAALCGPVEALPPDLAADAAVLNDAVSALVNLGYNKAQAERAVQTALPACGEAPALERLLKEALRCLAA